MNASMIELAEGELNQRRVAYLMQVRSLHAGKRQAGFVACLVGALMLVFARMRPEASPAWLMPASLVVIGAGWLLFAYVIVMRTRYVRSHPFDPKN
jgi:hypothetical protein